MTEAEKHVAAATQGAGKAAERSSRQMDHAQGSLGGVFKSVTGLVGSAGLKKALEIINERVEAMIERLNTAAGKVNDLAQATLDLHALSFEFNAEDQAFVESQVQRGGRAVKEVASANTAFKSATGHLNPQQQREIFHAAVTVPGMATNGGLAPLATFAARASRYESDPQKLANMMAAAVQQGGEPDPATLFEYGSQLLESGKQAGLEAEDTLGLLAFGSKGMPTAQAATHLRNVMLRLQLDANTGKVLRRYGVNEAGFFDKLDALRQKDVSGADPVAMVGIENSGMLSSLLSNYDDVQRIQAEMEGQGQRVKHLRRLPAGHGREKPAVPHAAEEDAGTAGRAEHHGRRPAGHECGRGPKRRRASPACRPGRGEADAARGAAAAEVFRRRDWAGRRPRVGGAGA